ncbi:hypothetical protein ACH5RR_008785 [Cinchona calisaya]|uniref:Uncharacterized protein n=1 Tax=Cinchona calisaya TaxID=153742 RepID=A0ABD3AE85_9GENT
MASERFRTNSVKGLWNSECIWCDKLEKIDDIIQNHFKSMFQSSTPSEDVLNRVLQRGQSKFSSKINNQLLKAFSEKRGTKALSQMFPIKPPRSSWLRNWFLSKPPSSAKSSQQERSKNAVADKPTVEKIWKPKTHPALEVGASRLSLVGKFLIPMVQVECNEVWNALNEAKDSAVTHLNRFSSDHSPLLWSISSMKEGGHCPFRFQNMWVRHHSFLATVKDNWSQHIMGSGMLAFSLKLHCLKWRLKEWYRDEFGNIFYMICMAEKEVACKER